LAEKYKELKPNTSINTNIDFVDVQKDEINISQAVDVIKIAFKFTIAYSDPEIKKEKDAKEAEIILHGAMVLTTNEDESKDLLKSWKKKEVPENYKISLFNLILRKCSLKSLQLEEELGLPSHMPLPQLRPQPKQ
jgi:hypothetical protein